MKTILFYGDSNTYGFDPRGFGGGRYPADVRWTDRLAAGSRDHLNILVNAMNGREIPDSEYSVKQFLKMLDHAVKEQNTDILGIMLGTNDLFSAPVGRAAVFAAARMSRFLDRIMAGFPELKILVIAPPVIGGRAFPEVQGMYMESVQLSRMYHVLAVQRGLEFASAAEWDIPLAFDGVHLSEEGHAAFALEMKKVIDDLSL